MPWSLLAGILIGAVVAGSGVLYWLRDRLSGHAAPRERREAAQPARHRAPARRVIPRAKTAAEPPAEFLAIPSFPPPEPGEAQPVPVPAMTDWAPPPPPVPLSDAPTITAMPAIPS